MMVYTADELLALYEAMPSVDRLRFDEAHAQALAGRLGRYRRCTAVRLERVAERNRALHRLIAERKLPTATLENWRIIHANLHLPHVTDNPEGLRQSYRKWLSTTPAPHHGAA